jgi:hypothetical protein
MRSAYCALRITGWRKTPVLHGDLRGSMYAKNLEHILALLCNRSDVSRGTAQELDERFKSLRDYGRLPRGRERREEKLSNKHIAAAVFGLCVTAHVLLMSAWTIKLHGRRKKNLSNSTVTTWF